MPSQRFLPPDPRVEEPYRLTPQLAFRIGVLGAVAFAVFAVLFLRLWALQVLSGEEYRRAALNNQLRLVRTEPQRGLIFDRRGRVLVENEPTTAVKIWPSDLPPEGRYRELKRLARILKVPLSRITADVEKRKGDPVTPVTVKTGVTEAEVLYISERRDEFPGVRIVDTHVRRYPHGAVAAHLLGHVGEISEEQLKEKAKQGYRLGDKIGQGGVEAAYDRYLRGRPGLDDLRVDSRGRARSGPRPRQTPSPGNSIRLTLDLKLQQTAERALRDWIARARDQDCFGCWAARGGAIVALDPRNGAIRAMASSPSYHPTVFVGRVDPKELARAGLIPSTAAGRNFPGLNRATAGLYPAGSTWKPVTALAAMQERLMAPYDPILCSPDYVAYEQTFKNWTPSVYQWLTLPQALEQSCDTYFYRLGDAFYQLPADRGQPLQEWAFRFGFGKTTGLDIGGDAAGLIPTIKWRKETFKAEIDRIWKPGYSIQLAIGQQDLRLTPLQMARFYALIANGGQLVTPHLGRAVEQSGTSGAARVTLRAFTAPRLRPVGVDPAALRAVQLGLYQATHGANGTATSVFGSFSVDIAGKTGTAEKAVVLPGFTGAALVDQAWWCGYGPYERAELVVCALIENGGHGGSVAAPAALEVFEEYFGVSAEYEVPTATETD